MTPAELLLRLRADLGAPVLAALGYGLGLAPAPLSFLGQAFVYEADSHQAGGEVDRLAEISMRLALTRIRTDDALMESLESASGPPWSYVFEAVLASAEGSA